MQRKESVELIYIDIEPEVAFKKLQKPQTKLSSLKFKFQKKIKSLY